MEGPRQRYTNCKHYKKGNKCLAPVEERCPFWTRKLRIHTKCLLRRRPYAFVICGQFEPIELELQCVFKGVGMTTR